MDLDVAVQRRVAIFQSQVAFAAAEERHEDFAEIHAHLFERRHEQLARRRVDLLDGLQQRGARVEQVGALRDEELVALHRFVVLLDRERVHRSELFELATQLVGFRLQRLVVQLHGRDFRDHLVERTLPLRLETLANGQLTPRQLGEAEFGVM